MAEKSNEETEVKTTEETNTAESDVKIETPTTEETTVSEEKSEAPATEETKSDEKTTKESNKRPADDAGDDENPKKQFRSDSNFIIKMLCPFWCAGAVIGSGGECIKKMKDDTGCSLKISKNFENFPTTNERVVSFKGDMEQIKKLIVQVQDKIRTDNPPDSAPKRDNSKRKGYLKLVVAASSAGRIIGKGGARTKQLQEDHNTHIEVMRSSDLPRGLNESIVSITGSSDKVDECMQEVVDIVAEDSKASMNWNVDYKFYHDNKGGRGGEQHAGHGGYTNNYHSGGGYAGGYGGYNQGYGGYNQGYGYGGGPYHQPGYGGYGGGFGQYRGGYGYGYGYNR